MKTKLRFLFVLLTMLWWGANFAWGDTTYSISFNNANVQTPAGSTYFTWNEAKHNFNNKFNGATYADIIFSSGLKMEDNTKITFTTTTSNSTVVIVQSTWSSNTIKLDNTELAIASASEGSNYRKYTISNVEEGTHNITKGSGESGLFYVSVTQIGKPNPRLSFANEGNGTARIGDGWYSQDYETSFYNSGDGSVTYSISPSGSGATITSAGKVTATAAGTYTIRATTSETENYNSSYAEYTLTVTSGVGTGTYSGSTTKPRIRYPHKWDFTSSSSDWAASQTQITTTYGDWGGSDTYYYNTHNYGTYPVYYNIDVIKGLGFTQNWTGLDWGYGHIWYGAGSITIPGLYAGQTITFVMEGQGDGATTVTAPNTTGTYTIPNSYNNHGTYVYTVTANGDVTFTFDKAVSIRSIEASAVPGQTRNTFVWNFAKSISPIDNKILNATTDTWGLSKGDWSLNGGTNLTTGFTQGGKELEHVYGLQANINSNSNNLLYTNGGGFRFDNKSGMYIRIPNLKAGDKVTVLCNNYNGDGNRGFNKPSNIDEADATGWGNHGSGEFTCVGYVTNDGYVDLAGNSGFDVKTITVESTNKPWPELAFANCAASGTVNVKLPYGSTSGTYTNTLAVPEGCGAITYSILLGNATVNASTGQVTINTPGEVIVRATTAGGDNYSHYYCDYIINATETTFTMYSSSADTYEWRFFDSSWWVTSNELLSESTSNWWLDTSTFKSNEVKNNSGITLHTSGSSILPETNNLTFANSQNGSRIGVEVGEYLWLGTGASITLPSLPAGSKVTIRANSHMSGKTLNVSNGNVSNFNLTTTTADFSFTVSSAGSVTLSNSSGDWMRILAISVEKPEFTFSERKTQIHPDIVTKVTTYNGSEQVFWVQANVTEGVSLSKSDFTVTSSNNDVVNVGDWDYSLVNSTQHWFYNLKTGKPGTAVLTFTFKGNTNYASKSFTVTLNVLKADIPYFEYANYDKIAQSDPYTNGTMSKAMHYITNDYRMPPFDNVTFASTNEEVATVNSSTGEITYVKPGVSVITATFAGNDYYNDAKTYFKLEVTGTTNPVTINWTQTGNTPSTPPAAGGESYITRTMGDNDITYPATASDNSKVLYMSSDPNIVSVNSDGKIHVNHPGVAYIYAYINGTTEGMSGVCKDYKVQVNGGELTVFFEPSSGTVTTGRVLMPRLAIPSLEKADISSLTLTVEDGGGNFVSVPSNLLQNEYLKMAGTRIEKVYPRITGLKPTSSSVKVTAHFISPYYNDGAELTADFYVTVTDDINLFNWKTATGDATLKKEYTIVEGEFMMMPAITGNANGNIDGLSNGTVNVARHGYLYAIEGEERTLTWNNDDYYYGEGVPDYTLTPASIGGGLAYIVNVTGEDGNHPALMIYGESAGDVILRATDSQTGYTPTDDIIIHVVSKANSVTYKENSFWADKKFPFTWDFTTIQPTDITDDVVHWKSREHGNSTTTKMDPVAGSAADGGCHIMGMAASLDYDYGKEVGATQVRGAHTDIKNPHNSYPRIIRKYITTGEGENNKIMPAFHGMRIALGNHQQGKYSNKIDKVRIYDTSSGDPRLYIVGGPHNLYLPAMEPSKTPGTYKLVMKVKGHKRDNECLYDDDGNVTSGNLNKGHCSHVSVAILQGEDNLDGSGNEQVVATIATEEVIIAQKNGDYTSQILSFDIPTALAGKIIRLTFDQDVDIYWIALSTEEKEVYQPESTNYPSSTYSYSKALDLAKSAEVNEGMTAYYASGFDETTNSVTMSPLSNNVESREGLLLRFSGKTTTEDDPLSCYMIADPENKGTYSEPSNVSTNYLVGTVDETVTPSRFTTVGSDKYTNFVLTNVYWKVYDDGESDEGVTVIDPTEISDDWKFVRTAGNVEVGPQKAYLRLPGRLLNLNTSNVSASRAVLNIVFDDDAEATGIANVKQGNSIRGNDDGWYTLQGVKVMTPTKGGIYIHNGKKVAIK